MIAGVVLVLVAALMALARNHGSGYDTELERQAALEGAQAAAAIAPPAPSPGVPAPASMPALEAAPVVHQHVHFHGVSDRDLVDVVRKAIRSPEERRWARARRAGRPAVGRSFTLIIRQQDPGRHPVVTVIVVAVPIYLGFHLGDQSGPAALDDGRG